jgi:UDP-glucose 4-epimerase
MTTFLVTGGAGFIGSALVDRLVERGHSVRVVDNFSTGFRQNLAHCLERIQLLEGDLAEFSVCKAAVQGVEYVLHQAAIPSVQRSVEDPIRSNNANVTATLNLLVAARDSKAKRFVLASSSSVYGDSELLPKVETMRENPLSPYALSKLAAEKYCVVFHRIYGLSTVSLRYFNVFGPRQDPHSLYSAVISRFVEAALRGTRPIVYGDGEQSRDFTYVDNVVEANLLACQAEGVGGMVFNIGTGGRHTLNDLLAALSAIVGRKLEPECAAARLGDVRHSQAEIEKARRSLGFEPAVSFQEGLERTVDWFRRNLEPRPGLQMAR